MMIEKIRKNYSLANLLVRLIFVVSVVLLNWKIGLLSVQTVMEIAPIPTQNVVAFNVLVLAIVGLFAMLIVPLLSGVFLNFSAFYTVQRAEYNVLLFLHLALYNGIICVLRLVNYLTPLFMIWIEVIAPIIAGLVVAFLFYRVTAKLYFNEVTRVAYFKNLAILSLVLIFVGAWLA